MKVLLISIGLVVIIGLGVFLFNKTNSDETITENLENQSTQIHESQTVEQQEAEQTAALGVFVDFSEEALREHAETKRVVFFHADWCSTCNFYKRQIESADVPSGITILKADYDNDTELKARYGVNVQSTFVLLDEDGEVLRIWPFAAGLNGAESLYEQVLSI